MATNARVRSFSFGGRSSVWSFCDCLSSYSYLVAGCSFIPAQTFGCNATPVCADMANACDSVATHRTGLICTASGLIAQTMFAPMINLAPKADIIPFRCVLGVCHEYTHTDGRQAPNEHCAQLMTECAAIRSAGEIFSASHT